MLRAVLVALVLVLAVACGGRQQVEEDRRERAPAERPTCVPAYWEAPPAQIGDVPPERRAPDEVLESFHYADPLSGEEEEESADEGEDEGAPETP